jgi:hypothetical protein
MKMITTTMTLASVPLSITGIAGPPKKCCYEVMGGPCRRRRQCERVGAEAVDLECAEQLS